MYSADRTVSVNCEINTTVCLTKLKYCLIYHNTFLCVYTDNIWHCLRHTRCRLLLFLRCLILYNTHATCKLNRCSGRSCFRLFLFFNRNRCCKGFRLYCIRLIYVTRSPDLLRWIINNLIILHLNRSLLNDLCTVDSYVLHNRWFLDQIIQILSIDQYRFFFHLTFSRNLCHTLSSMCNLLDIKCMWLFFTDVRQISTRQHLCHTF